MEADLNEEKRLLEMDRERELIGHRFVYDFATRTSDAMEMNLMSFFGHSHSESSDNAAGGYFNAWKHERKLTRFQSGVMIRLMDILIAFSRYHMPRADLNYREARYRKNLKQVAPFPPNRV